MDDIRSRHEIDAAMRELAQRRDQALTNVPALSSARRMALTALVARQLPLEATVHEVAVKRDQALHRNAARIPAAVESVLQRQLAAVEAQSSRRHLALGLNRWRSPLAAVLAVCALITAALLGFGKWHAAARRNAMNVPAAAPADNISVESGLEPFTRMVAIGPFNLNTNEPASLQASFLASRRIRFADGNETPLGLRLDLPVRAALMEDEVARTP